MTISPPLPSEIVVSDQIVLRRQFDTRPEAVHALVHRNLEHLARFMSWATPDYSLEGVEAYMQTGRDRWGETGEHGYSVFFEGELAGATGIRGFESPVRAVSIGYWLSAHLEGNGIITRSVEALIRMAFADYGMNQVVIRAASHNRRSRAIPERLGFTEVGIERQMTANAAGDLFDLVNYSMLRDEWQERHS